MIRKYKRKSEIVEAIQYTGDNFVEVEQFVGTQFNIKSLYPTVVFLKDKTGEVFIMTPSQFKEAYEEVNHYDLGDVLTDIHFLGKPCPPKELLKEE